MGRDVGYWSPALDGESLPAPRLRRFRRVVAWACEGSRLCRRKSEAVR
jgi:hypothetical protein